MILYFLAAGGIRNQKYAKYVQDVSVFSIIHHPKAELCIQQGTSNILSLFHGSGKTNRKNVVQFKNLKAHWCADTYFVNLKFVSNLLSYVMLYYSMYSWFEADSWNWFIKN